MPLRAFSHTPLQRISQLRMPSLENHEKRYMYLIKNMLFNKIVHSPHVLWSWWGKAGLKLPWVCHFGCVKQVSVFIAEIRLLPSLKIHLPALFLFIQLCFSLSGSSCVSNLRWHQPCSPHFKKTDIHDSWIFSFVNECENALPWCSSFFVHFITIKSVWNLAW